MNWLSNASTGLVLKVTLSGSKPSIWRRFAVPADIPLDRLHDILQIVMGWQDMHLHRFEIGGVRFSEGPEDPVSEGQEETGVPLDSVLAEGTDRFYYEYDYGDRWYHIINVEDRFGVGSKEMVVLNCPTGSGACPPEDIGGIGGYEEALGAITNPEHEAHEWAVERFGKQFDPGALDLDTINIELHKYVRWSRERRTKSA